MQMESLNLLLPTFVHCVLGSVHLSQFPKFSEVTKTNVLSFHPSKVFISFTILFSRFYTVPSHSSDCTVPSPSISLLFIPFYLTSPSLIGNHSSEFNVYYFVCVLARHVFSVSICFIHFKKCFVVDILKKAQIEDIMMNSFGPFLDPALTVINILLTLSIPCTFFF